MSAAFSKSLVFLSIFFVACSPSRHEVSHLFYGECKVAVTAEPVDAEIIIDGIPVGKRKAKVEIPCGEKQIQVESEGFRPYYKYLSVARGTPLDVKVKLEKLEHVENYALSQELADQVRNGKKLRNPFISSDTKQSMQEEDEKEAPIALDLGSTQSSEGAAGSLPPGDVNSVDYWR